MIDMVNDIELPVETQKYFWIGKGVARLHATGATLESDALFDDKNFMVVPPANEIVMSPLGLARFYIVNNSFAPLSPEQRAHSLLPAALLIGLPCLAAFTVGYREVSQELGQLEIVEDTLSIIVLHLARIKEARELQSRSIQLGAERKYVESIELLKQEIEIYEQIDLEMIIGRVYVNLGSDFSSIGDETHAMESYQKAYEIARNYHDDYGLIVACTSLASHYQQHGFKQLAREYADQAFEKLSEAKMPPYDKGVIRQTLERLMDK